MNTLNVAQNQELCKVFFDRSAKQYIVRNGQLVGTFPAGKENKVKAQWLAVEYDAPELATIARELLAEGFADEGRIIRAARLLIEGKLEINQKDGDYLRATAPASGDNRSPITGLDHYQVYHNLTWQCDCFDYERCWEDNHQHKCKHIIAAEIARRKIANVSEAAQRKAQDWADQLAEQDSGNSWGGKHERDTALPAYVDERRSIEDFLGYDEPTEKPWYLRPDKLNLTTNFYRNFNDRGRVW